jgi:hypothetical protein
MLDKINGEFLDGLGEHYVVVPWRKWADTNLGQTAIETARKAFATKGALLPVIITEDDILVQEYPLDHRIAVIVVRKIAGEVVYYPWVCKLPPDTIAELRVAGRWQHSAAIH